MLANIFRATALPDAPPFDRSSDAPRFFLWCDAVLDTMERRERTYALFNAVYDLWILFNLMSVTSKAWWLFVALVPLCIYMWVLLWRLRAQRLRFIQHIEHVHEAMWEWRTTRGANE